MNMLILRQLTDSITERINMGRSEEEKVVVFPYSVFYVFYEQVKNISQDIKVVIEMFPST